MVDSRQKGARAEADIVKKLHEATGLNFKRIPMSGALDASHGLKGDVYIPNSLNIFCIEVKSYEEDHLTSKVLSNTSSHLLNWWDQCRRQAAQVSRKPLLIFKFNRSKVFVAYEDIPNNVDHFFISAQGRNFFVSILDDWLKVENPRFI